MLNFFRMKNFNSLIFFISFTVFAQNLPNDCENYIQACGNQSVSYNVSGAGVQEIIPQSCSSNEHNSLWLRVTIEQGGTLGFTIKPQSTSINEDYDFWVFGPAADCASKGSPIRCSTTNPFAANQSNNWTGLNAAATDTTEGPGAAGNSFVQQLTVTAGQSYFIVIDRPIGNSPFDLEWSGTATLFNPFTSVVFPDFPEVSLCDAANDNVEPYDFSVLTADYVSSLTGYEVNYYTTEINAVTNNNPISGITNVSNGIYYARVTHTNSNCFEIKPITVVFGNLTVNEVNESLCETALGQGATLDLSNYQDQAYIPNTGVTYTFYTSLANANTQTNPITNTIINNLIVGSYTYFVHVEKGVCSEVSSINIEVNPLPNTTTPIELVQCDNNTDGFTAFNLFEAQSLFLNVNNDETVLFFEDALLTSPINNPTAFNNTTVNNQQVYAEITTANGCSSLVTINLTVVTTQIDSNFEEVLTLCDDILSGSNTDEKSTFNIESTTPTFLGLFTSGQQISIHYYENYEDALAEQNEIINTSAYTNTTNPQSIYVRVESAISNACLGIGPHVKLQVEALPITPNLNFNGCETTNSGTAFFDTSTIESELTHGLAPVSIAYFDANNNPLSSPLPVSFETETQDVTAVLTNIGGQQCSYTATISFVVNSQPVFNNVPLNLITACDDELVPADQDGIFPFDTSGIEAAILGSQTNMQITYSDGLFNPLPSPLPNPYYSTTQNVNVRIENIDNPDCFITGIIPFAVLELPYITLQEEKIICDEVDGFEVLIDAGLGIPATQNQFSYIWYKDGLVIANENSYSLTVTEAAVYTVEVYTLNLCFRTRTVNVMSSSNAEVISINTASYEELNTLEVIVSGNGDYEFSLDGLQFQDSSIFTNITAGEYTVWVQDKNGCGITSEAISVFGIPLYFTPNNDGYNDTWNVKGYSNNTYPIITTFIYDKMGKLIKQIDSASQGWDGKRLGVDLPSDDYWYVINMPNGTQRKGHFVLKR